MRKLTNFLCLTILALIAPSYASAEPGLERAAKDFSKDCRTRPRKEQGAAYHYQFSDGSRLTLIVIDQRISSKRSQGQQAAGAERSLKGVETLEEASAVLGRTYSSAEPYARLVCEGDTVFFRTMEVQGRKLINGSNPSASRSGATTAQIEQLKALEQRKRTAGKLSSEEQRQVRELRASLHAARKMTPQLQRRFQALDSTDAGSTRF